MSRERVQTAFKHLTAKWKSLWANETFKKCLVDDLQAIFATAIGIGILFLLLSQKGCAVSDPDLNATHPSVHREGTGVPYLPLGNALPSLPPFGAPVKPPEGGRNGYQ